MLVDSRAFTADINRNSPYTQYGLLRIDLSHMRGFCLGGTWGCSVWIMSWSMNRLMIGT